MTTDKPEVVGYIAKRDLEYDGCRLGPVCMTADSYPGSVALIRLSDYEALQAECENLRKDAERYQSLLEAVLREIPHREGRRGNAPGHCHAVPGVWDEDNGALAGKECAWCKVWSEALTAIQEHNP